MKEDFRAIYSPMPVVTYLELKLQILLLSPELRIAPQEIAKLKHSRATSAGRNTSC